jgi:ABC-type transport system involved in Fe-S cluster assembly fused permease/ATPase subunit
VRINDVDLRSATLASVHDTVGVVTQEAHLFHDTVRANLAYARPGATAADMERALRDAQIWDLVSVAARGAGHGRRRTAGTGCRAVRSSGSRWPGCCSRGRA